MGETLGGTLAVQHCQESAQSECGGDFPSCATARDVAQHGEAARRARSETPRFAGRGHVCTTHPGGHAHVSARAQNVRK